MHKRYFLLPALLLAGLAVANSQKAASAAATDESMLNQVATFHGAAGVFAVAGYRMGERALRELNEPRGSFALDVTHKTPMKVQYSCIADGWQAATGVSAGKLNLHIVETEPSQMETVIEDHKTGQRLAFRIKPEFIRKYLNTPYSDQSKAAREVAALRDADIFEMKREKAGSNSR